MSNYQPHNPNLTEHQRERDRWARNQDDSDNAGQDDSDLYDRQQEARYAWNHDSDYYDIGSPGYSEADFDMQSYRQQHLNQTSGNEEPSYQQRRYSKQGGGFSSAQRTNRGAEFRGRPGHSTWGQHSDSSRNRGNYPDYDAMNATREHRNTTRLWESSAGGENSRGRVSYADHWPPNGYQTQQPQGASPRWQNDPSYSQHLSHRGAYGLQVDQPTDYSLGSEPQSGRGYTDQYNADSYYYADRDRSNDRNFNFNQGSGTSTQGYRGRGPKGYERSDERVREDVCERLALDPHIDASEITVSVKAGVVTLEGSIAERAQKHRAEDIADSCSGVKDVQNRLNVAPRYQRGSLSGQQSAQSFSSSLDDSTQQSSESGEAKTMSQQKPTRQ